MSGCTTLSRCCTSHAACSRCCRRSRTMLTSTRFVRCWKSARRRTAARAARAWRSCGRVVGKRLASMRWSSGRRTRGRDRLCGGGRRRRGRRRAHGALARSTRRRTVERGARSGRLQAQGSADARLPASSLRGRRGHVGALVSCARCTLRSVRAESRTRLVAARPPCRCCRAGCSRAGARTRWSATSTRARPSTRRARPASEAGADALEAINASSPGHVIALEPGNPTSISGRRTTG